MVQVFVDKLIATKKKKLEKDFQSLAITLNMDYGGCGLTGAQV